MKFSFSTLVPGDSKFETIFSDRELTEFGHPDRNYLFFGAPGDVYISLGPGKYTVYGKTSSMDWKIWPWALMVLNGLRHPAYSEHILFTKESGRSTEVGWFRKRVCENNCEYVYF